MRRRITYIFVLLIGAAGGSMDPLSAQSDAWLFSDEEIIERAEGLPIEERRYLTYLYAKLNKPRVARSVGTTVLRDNPSDRQTLLVLASLATERQEGQETVRLAEAFLEHYPDDHQGLYFLGAGYYLQKRFVESERVLADLKRDQFSGEPYPYETDLAAASSAAGQWYRSMLSYQQLLRHHDLNDELRSEVRRELDRIYREHGPRLDGNYRGVVLDEGRVWRRVAEHQMHLTERHRWGVEMHQDDVSLEGGQGLLPRETTRADLATNLHSTWGARSESEVGVGETSQGTFWGMRVRHEIAPSRGIEIQARKNIRATDSLLLESLDGRQDALEFGVGWLIEADLAANFRASARRVSAEGVGLGEGMSLELSVDQVLRRRGAQWVLGYRGAYSEFDTTLRDTSILRESVVPGLPPRGRQSVIDNLVAPKINRHGVGLVVSDDLTRAWSYRLMLGADYDFVLDDLGYNYAMAWVFRPRKSIELGVEGGYYSSATASNAGSSAYVLDLSFRVYY